MYVACHWSFQHDSEGWSRLSPVLNNNKNINRQESVLPFIILSFLSPSLSFICVFLYECCTSVVCASA